MKLRELRILSEAKGMVKDKAGIENNLQNRLIPQFMRQQPKE